MQPPRVGQSNKAIISGSASGQKLKKRYLYFVIIKQKIEFILPSEMTCRNPFFENYRYSWGKWTKQFCMKLCYLQYHAIWSG